MVVLVSACAEIVNGTVTDERGMEVHEAYCHAVDCAMEAIKGKQIDLAVLQSRSPTCGVNQIYDGSFTGKLTAGHGLFAQKLMDMGYTVKDSEEFK